MSRKGNCYDNALVESFWGTLKEKLVYHRRFRTRVEAQAAIQEYIEVFYNRMRRHSALGNLAPAVGHFHLNPQKFTRYTNHERPFLLLEGRRPHEAEAERARQGVPTPRSIG